MANTNPIIEVNAKKISFTGLDLINALMDDLDIYQIISLMIDSNSEHMQECKDNELLARQEEHIWLVRFRDIFKKLRDQQLKELGV